MPNRTQQETLLPREPIDRWFEPLEALLHVETANDIVLVSAR
jgi:hypothetical protein